MNGQRASQEIERVANWAMANTNHPRNTVKGSWRSMSRARLFWLFLLEVRELGAAMWTLYRLRRAFNRVPQWEEVVRVDYMNQIEDARNHVKHEIGDCVAFLAFLG